MKYWYLILNSAKVQTKEFETTLSANGVSSWSLHEEPCPATVQSVDPPTSIPDSVIKSTIVDDGPKQNIAGWTNCACKKYKVHYTIVMIN